MPTRHCARPSSCLHLHRGGKSMLARRLAANLPAGPSAEAIETTRLHSVAGPPATAGRWRRDPPLSRAPPEGLGCGTDRRRVPPEAGRGARWPTTACSSWINCSKDSRRHVLEGTAPTAGEEHHINTISCTSSSLLRSLSCLREWHTCSLPQLADALKWRGVEQHGNILGILGFALAGQGHRQEFSVAS